MKLNPKKCTFGVPLRKLLGYMVSHHIIDPNLENALAIMKIKPWVDLQQSQGLICKMVRNKEFQDLFSN
jgi:hypothetical protein